MKKKHQKQNKPDWFQGLVEEIEAIIVESRFNSQETIIRGKHAIGQAIVENESQASASELCSLVAGEIGVNKRTVQQAVQFYKADPKLKVLEGGKDISWRKILKTFQEPKEKEKKSKVMEHIWFGKTLSDCKKKELIEAVKHLVIQLENCNHKKFKCAEFYEIDKINL